jgi:hypothetical protein
VVVAPGALPEARDIPAGAVIAPGTDFGEPATTVDPFAVSPSS